MMMCVITLILRVDVRGLQLMEVIQFSAWKGEGCLEAPSGLLWYCEANVTIVCVCGSDDVCLEWRLGRHIV